MKRKCNLSKPETYTEKIQYRKLYEDNPLFSICTDKIRVRDWVKERMRESGIKKYLNMSRIYGIYENPSEISFDDMPNSFVIKPNNASGRIIIVKDKNEFDKKHSLQIIRKWMSRNFYYSSAERQYKSIKPRIVIEEFLEDKIIDYRIFCFGGCPSFIRVTEHDKNAQSGYAGQTYLCDWSVADFVWRSDSNTRDFPQPRRLNDMLEIASILSTHFSFVRVDLYEIKGEVYFSELTFTPASGYQKGLSYEVDKMLGELFVV